MAKARQASSAGTASAGRPSSLVDTRVIYCGDNLKTIREELVQHRSKKEKGKT